MTQYHWNAKDYEVHSQAQQKWARELIAKLDLNEKDDVLDIGCGDGKVTVEIANLVSLGSVVGIDSSPKMISLATEKYPTSNYANLSFELMDVTELPFKEEFDVIFSNAALHWVHNHQLTLTLLYRALRPGGRMLLQMGGKGNAEGMVTVLNNVLEKDEWRSYFENFEFPWRFLGTEEYGKWLKDAGFSIKRVDLIPKDMVQDSPSKLAGWVRTTWLPYLERLPKEKQEAFIDELVVNYINDVPLDAEGNVHMDMVRLEVEAIKM